MLIKPLDFALASLALTVVVASFLTAYTDASGSSVVNIKGESGEWAFPPDAVETIVVSGPLGDTVIKIQGGEARIVSSPCKNQTCVACGAVHAPGQWAACLPNRVMLYIGEGGSTDNIDAAVW